MGVKVRGENRQELRRLGLRWALTFGLLCLTILTVSTKVGYNKFNPAQQAISWEEVSTRFPIITLISIATALVAYYHGKNHFKKTRSQTLVCLGCNESITDTRRKICKCGGEVLDLDHAKWVENNDAENNENS